VRKIGIGFLAVVVLVLAGVVAGRLLTHAEPVTSTPQCQDNMRAIYAAIRRYRADHGGQYPVLIEYKGDVPLTPEQQAQVLVPKYLPKERTYCAEGAEVLGELQSQVPIYMWGLDAARHQWELGPGVAAFVDRELVAPLGKDLRLVTCPGRHSQSGGPGTKWPGFQVLLADGRIVRQPLSSSDRQPQIDRRIREEIAAETEIRTKR
jgi:hypothetical protein